MFLCMGVCMFFNASSFVSVCVFQVACVLVSVCSFMRLLLSVCVCVFQVACVFCVCLCVCVCVSISYGSCAAYFGEI